MPNLQFTNTKSSYVTAIGILSTVHVANQMLVLSGGMGNRLLPGHVWGHCLVLSGNHQTRSNGNSSPQTEQGTGLGTGPEAGPGVPPPHRAGPGTGAGVPPSLWTDKLKTLSSGVLRNECLMNCLTTIHHWTRTCRENLFYSVSNVSKLYFVIPRTWKAMYHVTNADKVHIVFIYLLFLLEFQTQHFWDFRYHIIWLNLCG